METKKRLLISFKTKHIHYNLLDVFYSHYIKIIQNLVYKNLNNGYILGKEKVVTLMYR